MWLVELDCGGTQSGTLSHSWWSTQTDNQQDPITVLLAALTALKIIQSFCAESHCTHSWLSVSSVYYMQQTVSHAPEQTSQRWSLTACLWYKPQSINSCSLTFDSPSDVSDRGCWRMSSTPWTRDSVRKWVTGAGTFSPLRRAEFEHHFGFGDN